MYDHSSIQAYKNCPYSYKLKFADRLSKREDGETEHDRMYGKAIHAGLDAFLLKKPYQEAFSSLYPTQLNEEDLAKTQANGITLLDEFAAWYPINYSAYEVVEVEQTLEVNLREGVTFVVKPDAVLRHKSSNEYYGMENKTTGNSLSPTFWNRFDPNAQITAQCAGIAQKYGDCSGVFVNGLSFGHRKRMYKGEPAGFHWSLERQLFNRNRVQIEAWKRDCLTWIQRIEQSKEQGSWGKNTEHCRWCSFKPICLAEWTPEEDMELIEEQFEQVSDPMEYLKGK